MKLTRQFTLIIRGDTHRINERDVIDHGKQLNYLTQRLLTGFPVAEEEFEAYGITVECERDMDQGD